MGRRWEDDGRASEVEGNGSWEGGEGREEKRVGEGIGKVVGGGESEER